ncbi:MAG: TrkH family potassium uptake protein [Candidatus Omnitrophica bacterium]|nr:TrkH family potassium uptake protein [Candidatus Omnitrophota bacterium]
MAIPLGWALHDNPHHIEVVAFSETILFGLAMAGIFLWIFRMKPEDYKRIGAKDGLAIVGLSWIVLSALGALPLYLSQSAPTYTDAFFETVSGFTTTGATVFTDIEALPRGILFWRSLTHWLGGMGIIVLYIALLPALGVNVSQLYKAEAPGLIVERLDPRIKETAKQLWKVYFTLSLLEAVLLWLCGMSVFDALCHTFGTMATGGFSTKNASIAAFGPQVQWVIIVFMFLSGINFVLHYQVLHGRFRAPWKNEEFRTYFLLLICLIPIFALVLFETNLAYYPIRDSAFQVVSILTTTGFVTADFELWPVGLKFLLVMLMFIGGCGGSTGGGMKVIRVLLVIKTAVASIIQAVFPNAVILIKSNSKPLPDKTITALMSYFCLFVLLFAVGSGVILFTENCDLVTATTAAISALSNIGPGLAKVGATQNFGWFSIPGKWALIFLMLAGRLELYSILILFAASTWKK